MEGLSWLASQPASQWVSTSGRPLLYNYQAVTIDQTGESATSLPPDLFPFGQVVSLMELPPFLLRPLICPPIGFDLIDLIVLIGTPENSIHNLLIRLFHRQWPLPSAVALPSAGHQSRTDHQ